MRNIVMVSFLLFLGLTGCREGETSRAETSPESILGLVPQETDEKDVSEMDDEINDNPEHRDLLKTEFSEYLYQIKDNCGVNEEAQYWTKKLINPSDKQLFWIGMLSGEQVRSWREKASTNLKKYSKEYSKILKGQKTNILNDLFAVFDFKDLTKKRHGMLYSYEIMVDYYKNNPNKKYDVSYEEVRPYIIKYFKRSLN